MRKTAASFFFLSEYLTLTYDTMLENMQLAGFSCLRGIVGLYPSHDRKEQADGRELTGDQIMEKNTGKRWALRITNTNILQYILT